MNSVVLHFGSRSGSWFALGLFAAMFGTLGWGVAREIRLRSKSDSGLARVLGLALLVAPVVMIYASSLSGFYEAQVDGPTLRLHYLFPGVSLRSRRRGRRDGATDSGDSRAAASANRRSFRPTI